MTRIRLLTVAWLVLFPLAGLADYLEVRRETAVYKEPSKKSEKLVTVDPAERSPYLLKLASGAKTKGYYQVNLPGANEKGWIYQSYVRRYKGQHPGYVAYKRTFYKHWIDEDGDCQDTRQEVLIRDADAKVAYQDEDHCKVEASAWKDPYTGKTFTNPKDLDVDHVVPLKNAHESGAWTWSAERKKQYANYLQYEKHLLAVSASENRKKADKGPDRYMPPNAAYHCEYVRIWTKIKRDWELEMTEAEGEKVQQILENCN
ncbi:MAG: HNH endonuclease [Gammaproteobacteria bacterium]|nr:MAG: HNH endonuclease [Gammaproteobacteria bacterium]